MEISILGINIKRIRESKGLSAYKLAKEAGISQSTISQIESGDRKSLNSSTVDKIAKALEVTTDSLYALETEVEYVVTDIEESIDVVLSDEDLKLDGKLLTTEEKKQIKNALESKLNELRYLRIKNRFVPASDHAIKSILRQSFDKDIND